MSYLNFTEMISDASGRAFMRISAAAISLFALTVFYGRVTAAQEVGINANLCRQGVISGQGVLSQASSPELVKYLDGLQRGIYAFSQAITPEQAASQLGFGARFRATYGLLVEEANNRVSRKGTINIKEIIEYLSGIVREEMAIERLISDPRYTPAILYLRAFEDGTCSFPYEIADVPTALFVLNQLAKAYPDMHLVMGRVFQNVYDRTLAFGANEIKQRGIVSYWRLVERWRQSVLDWHE